ncbi:MAG: dihydrolipoyl dehydrogenase [Candidatus Zixiibacteriota bacterium]
MKYDLCVIGAGPGGYVAAIRAAQLGLKTAVIERAKAGGICTSWGCIPSKALLHAANIIQEINHAKEYGITAELKGVDLDKLRQKKDRVVKRLVGGVELLLKKNGVDWIAGEAKLAGSDSISVTDPGGKSQTITAKHICLATGARPVELPHLKVDHETIVTYFEALEINGLPEHFVVVGGGAIGLEMAEVYAALGTKVTVVEMMPTVLPGLDSDLTRAAADILKKHGITVLTGTKVADAEQGKNKRWTLKLETAGGKFLDPLDADRVLVAVGLKPNSEGIGLDKAGVKTDKRGFIEVNEQMRTSAPNIYAIGDVTGRKLLAHKASREGHVVAEAIAGHHAVMDYRAVPSAIFLHPEIATVGLSEEEAKAAGYELNIGKFPLTALGRAVATDSINGFVKIVADKKTDRVLGVHIVAPTAGDMIAEGALAIEMEATAEDLAATIHVHPTFSEAIMESSAMSRGEAVHILRG